MESFAVQKLFLLYEVHLLIFGLNACNIGVLFRKIFPAPMSPSLFPTFSSIRFKSSCLLTPWIHFVLGSVQGSRCDSSSILLMKLSCSTSIPCWICCQFFFSVFIWFLCKNKNQVSITVWTCVCLQFSSMNVHVCFYANVMQFLFL